jgi:hypothetical protein
LGEAKQAPDFAGFFKGINIDLPKKIDGLSNPESRQLAYHWIIFLIISTLMHRKKDRSKKKLSNEDIKTLFRYISMGLNGFRRNN